MHANPSYITTCKDNSLNLYKRRVFPFLRRAQGMWRIYYLLQNARAMQFWTNLVVLFVFPSPVILSTKVQLIHCWRRRARASDIRTNRAFILQVHLQC